MTRNNLKYIGDVCSSISDTYHGHSEKVILINTSDVFDGKILNHEKVKNENLRGQFKKTFQQHDILYSEIRPQNKRFAYVDFSPTDYIASTKLMVIRAREQIILPQYLYYFLKSDAIITELQMIAETRSGTFPQITFSELSNLPISVPPIDVQARIVDIIKCIESKIDVNCQINDNLAFHKSISEISILPDISCGSKASRIVLSFSISMSFDLVIVIIGLII